MEDVTPIINIQGFILPNRQIAREVSWVHLHQGIGETISVFTPDSELDDQEMGIVRKCTNEVHGLRFKRYANNKGLWINNNDVKDYIKQLHELYGGTFVYKAVAYAEIFKGGGYSPVKLGFHFALNEGVEIFSGMCRGWSPEQRLIKSPRFQAPRGMEWGSNGHFFQFSAFISKTGCGTENCQTQKLKLIKFPSKWYIHVCTQVLP